jgi:hypothetical protein
MAVTRDDITKRFPEFSGFSNERLDLAIADATAQVNAGIFGTKANLAVIYLSAHLLAIGKNGSSGVVQSEKVGDIQRTYAVNAPTDASGGLGSTGYGAAFLNLRRQVVGPMVL